MYVACLGIALLGAVLVSAAPSTEGGSKACAHTGFFSKKVVPLCENHFPDANAKNLWVVTYYHPRAKESVESQEAFEQLARGDLAGAKVGAVDCEQNGPFCAKKGIRKVPTTYAISHGQTREFDGGATLEKLQGFVKDSSKKFKDMEEAMKCDVKGLFLDGKQDATVPLCTENFPPSLEPLPWMITFYEPGDRNKDKTMRKVLNKLAEKFGSSPPKKLDAKPKTLQLRVGAVDCSHSKSNCGKHGISDTLPVVRFYRSGAEPAAFDSFFDYDELHTWAKQRLAEIPPPEAAPLLEVDEAPQKEGATEGAKTEEL